LMDGTYDATTRLITGTLTLGARTGTFQLQ
jgi:hypothetical protein